MAIAMIFYPLGKKEHAKIVEQLKERSREEGLFDLEENSAIAPAAEAAVDGSLPSDVSEVNEEIFKEEATPNEENTDDLKF